MKYSISFNTYKGVDGSSLSQTRCDQIVSVYEMLESLGDKIITYIDIQEYAERHKLFGSTNAKSAVRTFFPLLKKMGFVIYEGSFKACECFTNLGKQFVFANRAIEKVNSETQHKDEILSKLCRIKVNTIRQGIVNMRSNPDCVNHNIWIAMELLYEFQVIHWNEFLYTLYCIDNGKTIEDAIHDIHNNKRVIDNSIFVSEDNKPLPTTCYTYIRGLLTEAQLIAKVNALESKVLDSFYFLYSQIQKKNE